jgi:hypothetical protein
MGDTQLPAPHSRPEASDGPQGSDASRDPLAKDQEVPAADAPVLERVDRAADEAWGAHPFGDLRPDRERIAHVRRGLEIEVGRVHRTTLE